MRDALADYLGILANKARTGELTDEDVETLAMVIRHAGGIRATIQDLAAYYGKSEDNIRHVIHRNFMPKPERRVYHDFDAFRKSVPSSWTGGGKKSSR